MGQLIDGEWVKDDFPRDDTGRFVRKPTKFHDEIEPEPGRYHLYVSYACPWAHRVLLARKLRKLEDFCSLSVVDPLMGEEGWAFSENQDCIPDLINHKNYLREVYVLADPDYTGRVTVPVLWDKKKQTITNNESRELLRKFSKLEQGDPEVKLCPEHLKNQIDEAIDAMYQPINNGVYRAGFAKSQEAYEEAVTELFQALDEWDKVLKHQAYLCGDQVTEADICLFTTLIRFDLVYHYHFKCNIRKIQDYSNLGPYLKRLYETPGFAETCQFSHIKSHYYWSHASVNPSRVIPKGPEQILN